MCHIFLQSENLFELGGITCETYITFFNIPHNVDLQVIFAEAEESQQNKHNPMRKTGWKHWLLFIILTEEITIFT